MDTQGPFDPPPAHPHLPMKWVNERRYYSVTAMVFHKPGTQMGRKITTRVPLCIVGAWERKTYGSQTILAWHNINAIKTGNLMMPCDCCNQCRLAPSSTAANIEDYRVFLAAVTLACHPPILPHYNYTFISFNRRWLQSMASGRSAILLYHLIRVNGSRLAASDFLYDDIPTACNPASPIINVIYVKKKSYSFLYSDCAWSCLTDWIDIISNTAVNHESLLLFFLISAYDFIAVIRDYRMHSKSILFG